jgi:DNA (cytosine-5)-methyltransferase 1
MEYLRIISDHKPPVFVMENVKGLLSATHSGNNMMDQIVRDLKDPDSVARRGGSSHGYRLFSLAEGRDHRSLEPADFVVAAEKYGMPQARHRIFILGIRDDISFTPETLTKKEAVTVASVIGDLPKVRSGISRELDNFEQWQSLLEAARSEKWYTKASSNGLLSTISKVESALQGIRELPVLSKGGEALPHRKRPAAYSEWYRGQCAPLVLNHTARNHMRSDLHRYLFASAYAAANNKSAQLSDFPAGLLPAHKNLGLTQKKNYFTDRFKVQIGDRPSTTITSHISKDGHYFIHFDPSQCRSLTVREAARLQTFPDSYKFEGNRTEQYHQVGNAVPPLLSAQIAEIVYDILKHIKI